MNLQVSVMIWSVGKIVGLMPCFVWQPISYVDTAYFVVYIVTVSHLK